ncbi:hypothetical protein E4N62_41840 [Streptomyces sp. MNU76]|uniref:hypothetical protein n=1 Tax=Streptomyces sp. MNU76 TaxID=2560026 RepID=UPI001E3477BF|nr:hypothetical protein [Streptomyces sp. MNU76]MCC9711199.1 hypothetical protein [Streptomyces sp. MNU76]
MNTPDSPDVNGSNDFNGANGSAGVASSAGPAGSAGSSGRPEKPPAPGLPTLAELGDDLLVTTRRQRIVALVRPGVGVLLFAGAVWFGWWWLTPLIVFGIFVAVVTVTHDVVHRTIGLSRPARRPASAVRRPVDPPTVPGD